MAWLIKRSDHPEINLTDGVFRTPVVDPGVWQEWRLLLAVPDPGYVVVSHKLWDSLVPSAPPPLPNPPPVPPIPVPAGWPTATTTGVPVGTVVLPTMVRRTSALPASDVVARAFEMGTDWVIVDRPTTFRNCRFTSTGAVSNTGAQVQASARAVFEDCSWDGGPSHNRGVQSDNADIEVRRGNFTRFGNAAVEKNDRNGLSSMLVEDCYLYEPKGWPRADHADGLQMGAGKNFTARHNTIHIEPYGATDGDTGYVSNSCIGLWAELGDVTGNVLIENNRMAGGGCVMYCEAKPPYQFRGSVTIRGNVFDRTRFPSLGGLAAIWHNLAPLGLPTITWTGNTFDDGTTVTFQQATQ